MHVADLEAAQVVERAYARFDEVERVPEHSKVCAGEGVLVGFEIEVPWRYYFPHLWDRYFQGGQRSHGEIPRAEQDALSRECTEIEKLLLPRLQATEVCGIKRGRDKYWEFILPPVQDLMLSVELVHILTSAKLLPPGFYSLHATISGLHSKTYAFVMLLLLELLFVRRERIERGYAPHGAWARRGTGGIAIKSPSNLMYSPTEAHELRTLELPLEPHAQEVLFTTIALLTHYFSNKDRGCGAVQKVRTILVAHGLPFETWQNPSVAPHLWQRYLERFEELQLLAREIVNNDLGILV